MPRLDLQARVLEHQVGKGADRAPRPLRSPSWTRRTAPIPSQPLNAWGVWTGSAGAGGAEADPRSRGAGPREAWRCGAPHRVRAALGWAASVTDHNGVSIVARYGFAGAVEWKQLDTSGATNPIDTKWVVRARVCLDAACLDSVEVFTAHWGGGGRTVLDKQARETVTFMSAIPAGQPHILIGDLNAYETVRRAAPRTLCDAVRVPAERQLHGRLEDLSERFGHRLHRHDESGRVRQSDRCPLQADRLRVVEEHPARRDAAVRHVPPGDGAPSDHYGIIVESRRPVQERRRTRVAHRIDHIARRGRLDERRRQRGRVSLGQYTRSCAWMSVLRRRAPRGRRPPPRISVAWDTAQSANGGHSLQAIAYDAAGNVGASLAIAVNVYNPPAPRAVLPGS